jgi:hypothetical protein
MRILLDECTPRPLMAKVRVILETAQPGHVYRTGG